MPSDHWALVLKKDINKGKKQSDEKKKDVIKKLRGSCNFFKSELRKNFSNHLILEEHMSKNLLLSAFKTFIVEAAKECAEVEIVAISDWLASNETELLLQIDPRNKEQETFDRTSSVEAKNTLKIRRKMLCNSVKKAKRNWIKVYTLKCTRAVFNPAPKKTWDIVFEIIKGFQGHYKKSAPKQFKDTKRRTKICEANNVDIIRK